MACLKIVKQWSVFYLFIYLLLNDKFNTHLMGLEATTLPPLLLRMEEALFEQELIISEVLPLT